MEQKYIVCTTHGKQAMALLCTHLAHSLHHQNPVGFHQYDAGDTGRPDAWCNTCEEAWNQAQTEEEREQWFIDCQHKIVCVSCWDEAKILNQIATKITFKQVTTAEIRSILLADQQTKHPFPKAVDFPFPSFYETVVTSIKTVTLSTETILFNASEATHENKSTDFSTYWIFAANGQGDRWLMDKEGQIFFGDHDQDPMRLDPMQLDFQQWLQLAFTVQQLDDWLDAAYTPEQLLLPFTAALNQIHPQLAENYPFEIA